VATSNVLAGLKDANAIIVLGLEIAGQLVPLVKGAITEIRKIGGGSTTVSYEIVVKADAAELDITTQLAVDDLAAINAELARMGLPPVPPYDSSTEARVPGRKSPDSLPPGVVPITDASVQGPPTKSPKKA
jgi:hypothetical protein